MIIWLLAVLLFGCLGLAGYSFGVIRAGITFIGLFISLLVVRLFGHSLEPVVRYLGVKNPALLWALAPFLVFVISLLVIKSLGFAVQRKVNLFYKYKAGDLRNGLWNRLNPRLGLCLGLANASVYVVLISVLIYNLGYATTQLTSDQPYWTLRLLNAAARNVEDSGLVRVVGAVDPMPPSYYDASDFAGLFYHNDLIEARLALYPGFLDMGERPEFKEIASDKDFRELRQKQAPISEILKSPKIAPIMDNPDLLKEIWNLVVPNLSDLTNFLFSPNMVSPKYADQKILGHWEFNLNGALSLYREDRTNITPREMLMTKTQMTLIYAKTTFLATPEKQAHLRNFGNIRIVPAAPGAGPAAPPPPPPPGRGAAPGGRGGRGGRGGPPAAGPVAVPPNSTITVDMQNFDGSWNGDPDNYRVQLGQGHNYRGKVDGDKLTLMGPGFPMVFDRVY